MTEETKVRFSLWSVLGAMCIAAILLFGDLYIGQRKIQDEAQACKSELTGRIIVIEENFKAIRDDNREIKQGLKEVVTALGAHEKTTMAAIRKSRGE